MRCLRALTDRHVPMSQSLGHRDMDASPGTSPRRTIVALPRWAAPQEAPTSRSSHAPNVCPDAVAHAWRPLQDRPVTIAPAVDGELNTTLRVRTPFVPSIRMDPSPTKRSCMAR